MVGNNTAVMLQQHCRDVAGVRVFVLSLQLLTAAAALLHNVGFLIIHCVLVA